jgi:glycine dehydrogenase subunit 2
MIATAYFAEKGEERRFVVIPDSAHGTNPASAGLCGYEVLVVPSGVDGCIDLDAFEKMMSRDVALVMLTCPNTLGIFEPNIDKICAIAHEHGALTYYDGANLNAVMGRFRPGDAGFDIMHTNLHKTFAAPHGGGGPGAGPVGVKKHLEPFLPMPRARKVDDEYIFIHEGRKSIGRVTSALGNVQVLIKAYAYILMLGGAGLKDASEKAVLNARYIAESLKGIVPLAYDAPCAHECVFSLKTFAERGATATDAAKYLIDRGIHPPTVYFPLIAKEAFMVEPTETESKATLDEFVACMKDWVGIVESDPAKVKEFPLSMSVRRVDELKAAKDLNLRHHCCE